MRFKAKLTAPTLDVNAWKTKVLTETEDTFERGVTAWLAAATAPVPVWSGASLATFGKLAARVNFVLSISPTPLGSRLGLGPSAGQAASTGRLYGSRSKGEFFAEYSTTLDHLVFNEFNDGNSDPRVFSRLRNPTPYNFQIAGNAAFRQVVDSYRLRLPRLKTGKTFKAG